MTQTHTYAFLGPKGTFSQEATLALAKNVAGVTRACEGDNFIECVTIPEVFEQVTSGHATYGVVPIENSLEGSVNATLDEFAFNGADIRILAEKTLDIHQNLIVAKGSTLEQITTIVSHPQATGQSARWIARNLPGRQVIASNSTAEAVPIALATPGYAAIGPHIAADIYGGEVLAARIEDFAGNQTRFALIGREEHALASKPSGCDKTSLALFLRTDKPGALLMILAEFDYGGINLSKIQSRPTKKGMGDYMFFVDLEGHVDDPDIKTALDSLKLKLREVRVLGSYPRDI